MQAATRQKRRAPFVLLPTTTSCSGEISHSHNPPHQLPAIASKPTAARMLCFPSLPFRHPPGGRCHPPPQQPRAVSGWLCSPPALPQGKASLASVTFPLHPAVPSSGSNTAAPRLGSGVPIFAQNERLFLYPAIMLYRHSVRHLNGRSRRPSASHKQCYNQLPQHKPSSHNPTGNSITPAGLLLALHQQKDADECHQPSQSWAPAGRNKPVRELLPKPPKSSWYYSA